MCHSKKQNIADIKDKNVKKKYKKLMCVKLNTSVARADHI